MPDTVAFRSLVSKITPDRIKLMRKRWEWKGIRKHYSELPVQEVFSQIYRTKAWGEADGEKYCSGFGSDQEFATPYVGLIARFVRDRQVRNLVDLGCGDFRVGRQIWNACPEIRYTGVDVVPDLIAYNQSRFGSDNVQFRCADLLTGDLPDADLCLIRQVLQHLSNQEVLHALHRARKYKYVLLTEEIYTGPGKRLNCDKPHGPDNRLYDRSGIYIELPPFNVLSRVVLELKASPVSVIRPSLIEHSIPSGS
jgi:ubiquinone/menaquinone biosynthesis C-methylase UbiE